jgi:hypothetical protein
VVARPVSGLVRNEFAPSQTSVLNKFTNKIYLNKTNLVQWLNANLHSLTVAGAA